MSAGRADAGLRRLAALHGVQLAYRSAVDGKPRRASPEALMKVLRALGAPIESLRDVDEALEARQRELAASLLEPVHVVRAGRAGRVPLRLPDRRAPGSVRVTVVLEDGGEVTTTLRLDRATRRAASREDGTAGPVVDLALPAPLPAGYHRVQVEGSFGLLDARVIATPGAPAPSLEPAWGVFLPLYAARASPSAACGTFGDLATLGDLATRSGGTLVGTLPLFPAFLDRPFDPSPYAPVSRLFWNELYLDLDRLPERAALRNLRAAAPQGELIDYRALAAARRSELARCARAFFARGDAAAAELGRRMARDPSLEGYALFRAATERLQAPWPAWPERLREGHLRSSDVDGDAREYHLYVQLRADEQLAAAAGHLRERGAALYLDLPLGTHPDGFDVWRHRSLFAAGAAGGAPPDHYSRLGQSWGFPPFHPDGLRRDGYAYFAACVRLLLRHAGALRLDHVMSLHRLYWVPDGGDARDGAYVRYRADEAYAVLAVEAHRAGAAIVGEDLGTVPGYVRAAMARHGIRRMYALQRASGTTPGKALAVVPPGCFASLNTHDHPTFAGWWSGADIADRAALGMLDEAGVARDLGRRTGAKDGLVRELARRGPTPRAGDVAAEALRALGASRAGAVIVNLEDLWGEKDPQNVPNTTTERPNWRRRARHDLEWILRSARVRSILAALDEARRAPRGERIKRRRPARRSGSS